MRSLLHFMIALLITSRAVAMDGETARQILSQKCYKCHGPDSEAREADLRLDTQEGIFATSDGRAAVVPGKPRQSTLIQRITAEDPAERMPPADSTLSLSPHEIKQLEQWVAGGAAWVGHWSFEPLNRPTIPQPSEESWARNDIDRFVKLKLEQAMLTPSPEADPARLVRRLSLDLTGLPPKEADVAEFVADPSESRYLAIVDRLLDSPHFGECWGQHWLDLARYADSDGYEMDYPRPHAWRWRDWVIQAVNDDMPLDQFAVEQLAGDLLPNAKRGQILATGFHRNSLTNTENGIDKEEFRVKAIVDRVNTTATVWLGLTVGCAECHSHKYDPIRHHEYYGLFAFFNNAVDEFDRPFVSGKEASQKQESKSLINVFQRRSSLRKTHVHVRGDFQQRGEPVAPGTPLVLHPFKPQAREGQAATRREPDRLDLAQWIVDPANPLTPRVEANRIWQHLFGQGLVRTPEDFGTQGEPPTHPKLLDYLATSLRQNGWSRKKLIRHIVQSAAYRQSSNRTPELIRKDPDNRLLGRQNRFRVEAEFVRDQYLAAAGLLSSRVGGPSFRPPLPESLAQIGFKMKWRPDSESEQLRRGMYIFYHRNLEYPGLKTFDRPDPNVSCVRRTRSNSPLQSLTQLHDDLFVKAARTLGLQISHLAEADSQNGIRLIYFKCLRRPPSTKELQILTALHHRLTQVYAMDPLAARKLVGDGNVPDSSTVIAATWIEVARTVMNLDEFVTRE